MKATVHKLPSAAEDISRDKLVELLNEDLAREYQAVISYVVYSQVLKGAEFMNIAAELEKHAGKELAHALIISNQIDYLGGMPAVQPKSVRTSDKPREMLKFDLGEREGNHPELSRTNSSNAKSWASMRWPNTFARSW